MSEVENTDDTLLSQSYRDTMNIIMLECLDDGSFRLIGSKVPTDFQFIYPEIIDQRDTLRPDIKFPYIEHFLDDARDAWEQGKHIRSGPWMEIGADGNEIALEVSTTVLQSKRILLMEILGDSYDVQHQMLQMGRENLLVQGVLEGLVHERTQDIREREEEIALRLVWAAEAKDGGETGAHIRRIGLYSAEMAKAIGWSLNLIDDIRLAATMHDVGKIAIPDIILRKPDKLTEDEFEIMKTHTMMGGRILGGSNVVMLHMAEDIAVYHHEKWDGSGYPHGLKGNAIPVSARIVSIVDVYDALINKRVYKEAWTEDDALESMLKDRGMRFDPELFDTFLTLRDVFRDIASAEYPPLFDGFSETYAY